MIRLLYFWSGILFLFCGISAVWGDIYHYTDKNGILHFTDSPDKAEVVLYFKETSRKGKRQRYPANEFDTIILQAAQEHDLHFSLLKALIKVESSFNPKAISRAGAEGLMQLMPATSKHMGVKNPLNPYENIMGGARYFRYLLDQFDGHLILAIAAYNAGPTAVKRYKAVPPFPETKRYVTKVLHYNMKYK